MTDGRRALLLVLARTRGKYIAARLSVTPAAVSQWASGRRTPSASSKKRLAVYYGIAVVLWGDRRIVYRARDR